MLTCLTYDLTLFIEKITKNFLYFDFDQTSSPNNFGDWSCKNELTNHKHGNRVRDLPRILDHGGIWLEVDISGFERTEDQELENAIVRSMKEVKFISI